MVDAVTSASNAAANKISAGSSMLASNFETFLALLTTQLKNQDPLSPMDSNEFTAQLTQMAGVEQQLLTNSLLNNLLKAQMGDGLTEAAAYIGKEATGIWSTTRFEDGAAKWSYELGDGAANVTLQVVNSAGQTVWSGPAPEKTNGVHDFTWDGTTTGGGKVDDGGIYTLKVFAKNGAGGDVDSQVLIRGRVTAVEMYDDTAYAAIGGSVMPISKLIALDEAKAASPTNPSTDDQGLMAMAASVRNPFN